MSNKSDLMARLAAIREINPELKYTRQEMENKASQRKQNSLFLQQLQPSLSPSAQPPQTSPRSTLPSTTAANNTRFVGLNVDFFRNSITLAAKETNHQEDISSVPNKEVTNPHQSPVSESSQSEVHEVPKVAQTEQVKVPTEGTSLIKLQPVQQQQSQKASSSGEAIEQQKPKEVAGFNSLFDNKPFGNMFNQQQIQKQEPVLVDENKQAPVIMMVNPNLFNNSKESVPVQGPGKNELKNMGPLFGKMPSAIPGGLFSGGTAAVGEASSGGLFSGAANTTSETSGGLFSGGIATTGEAPGGLFTATASVAPGGLFSGATATATPSVPTAGLFPTSTATPSVPTVGLFPTSTLTSTPSITPGGLFPISTATPSASTVGLFPVSTSTPTPTPTPSITPGGLFSKATNPAFKVDLFGPAKPESVSKSNILSNPIVEKDESSQQHKETTQSPRVLSPSKLASKLKFTVSTPLSEAINPIRLFGHNTDDNAESKPKEKEEPEVKQPEQPRSPEIVLPQSPVIQGHALKVQKDKETEPVASKAGFSLAPLAGMGNPFVNRLRSDEMEQQPIKKADASRFALKLTNTLNSGFNSQQEAKKEDTEGELKKTESQGILNAFGYSPNPLPSEGPIPSVFSKPTNQIKLFKTQPQNIPVQAPLQTIKLPLPQKIEEIKPSALPFFNVQQAKPESKPELPVVQEKKDVSPKSFLPQNMAVGPGGKTFELLNQKVFTSSDSKSKPNLFTGAVRLGNTTEDAIKSFDIPVEGKGPGLFGGQPDQSSTFGQQYFNKAATGGIFGGEKSIFGAAGTGTIFNAGPSSVFAQAAANPDQDEEDEQDDGPIAADDEIDPSKSTGNYEYTKSNALFKDQAIKFRQDGKETLQNTTVSLEKLSESSDSVYLIIRMANKCIAFNAMLLPAATQIRILNSNSKNLEIKKLLLQEGNQSKMAMVKVQLKDEQTGKRLLTQVEKILKK